MPYRIYTASKMRDGDYWESMREHVRPAGIVFHARWLEHHKKATPDTPENAKHFWVEDIEDVLVSHAVFVMGHPGTHLRGALVEVGAALAHAIPVLTIGKFPDYGTWQYHPKVVRCDDLDHAIHEFINRFRD